MCYHPFTPHLLYNTICGIPHPKYNRKEPSIVLCTILTAFAAEEMYIY